MIDINATLVLQAFHFFIAYVLIKNLLLKPAVILLYAQEKQTRDLLSTIKSYTHAVQQKEHEKNSLWAHTQSFFARHTPVLEKFISGKPTSVQQLVIPQISENQRSQTTEKLEETIITSWDTDAL